MTAGNQKLRGGRWVLAALFLLLLCSNAHAGDFTNLCADRAAIERVYYNHRLGEKPPFEQALPRATLENLVQLDLKKAVVLEKIYGVAITPALLDAEVNRINATTRAPDVLAEIKAALGNDPSRFAEVLAKPILVERLLRDRFENDAALHASIRAKCEHVRNALLDSRANGAGPAQLLAQLKQAGSNAVTEAVWQLAPRAPETNVPGPDEIEIKKRFGVNAQIISPPRNAAAEQEFYFDDLPPALQQVLRAQLRQPGDVSAVIETPTGFLLYLARDKTVRALSVAVLSLPKRDYDQWLGSLPESATVSSEKSRERAH